MNASCFFFDPVAGRCNSEGPAGARNDLMAMPSIDIANGAPTGTDATNEIVDAWTDGRNGLNNEVSLLSFSTDAGHHVFPAPWPLGDCLANFGNSDIHSATTAP